MTVASRWWWLMTLLWGNNDMTNEQLQIKMEHMPVMIDTQTGGIKVKANPENYGKDRDIIL
jgi:hypothetical protein